MKLSPSPIIALFSLLFACTSFAKEVKVAVAANFYMPMQQLAAEFEQQSHHQVQLSVGSTGKLYAQIKNGAPFELFLAADQRRPQQLIIDKLAVNSSQFTYAKGKLALWSSEPNRVDHQGALLTNSNNITHIAIASPKTAPYGAQSIKVLKQLHLYQQYKNKLVEGQNISQTYQHISTGNVRQGFVALSQITVNGQITSGSAWEIPANLYEPIYQDGVLLKKGQENPAAIALLTYMKSESAQQIIRSYGYDL